MQLLANSYERTTKGEVIKYLGIRLAMALSPLPGGVRAYWETITSKEGKETIHMGGDYRKRFGMSRNRFTELSSCFRLCIPEDPTLPPDRKVNI